MSKASFRNRPKLLDKQHQHVVKPMSFRCWLKSQRDRDDETGDLARKVLASRELPKNNLRDYRAHLIEVGSPDSILEALADAWCSYEESLRS
jgi:hypothetical protein